MDPVLIYTDTTKIALEKSVLTKVATTYQAIYNAIKALGITPTLNEISTLDQYRRSGNAKGDFVNDYVLTKLTDQLAPYQLNGVTMTREFFQNNIQIPDTTALKTALDAVEGIYADSVNGARLNLLSLAADVISKVGDSDAQITTIYTYYTQNDISAQVATDLQAVCDALNTFDESNALAMQNTFTANISIYGKQVAAKMNLPGIALLNGSFVVSLEYIRKREGA